MSFRSAQAKASIPVPARERAVSGSGANTWDSGALLKDSSGTWLECGTDPTDAAAVALHPVNTASGLASYPLGRKEFPPNKALAIPLDTTQSWSALYMGTLPATLGGTAGVTKDTDGKWKVDFSKSGKVTLVGWGNTRAPISGKRVVVRFASGTLATA